MDKGHQVQLPIIFVREYALIERQPLTPCPMHHKGGEIKQRLENLWLLSREKIRGFAEIPVPSLRREWRPSAAVLVSGRQRRQCVSSWSMWARNAVILNWRL